MEKKRFEDWIDLKKGLHYNKKCPRILEGEVWWCSFGENVGVEINGKSEAFTRPVLIMKKLSRFGFMGIPLTSQKHEGSWWVEFEFLNKTEFAVVGQARVLSVSRLYSKMGQIPESDLNKIRDGFISLYQKNVPPSEERGDGGYSRI